MSRTKLFIHNFLVYGLGSIISKIIPLIMLPVITSIMTDTKYYGINDMVNLVISFASAIAMMGMYDAMFRMFFDKEDDNYKKSICSTALFFVILSSLVICIIMFIFRKAILNLIINDVEYNLLFFIIIFNTFLTGVQGIVSAPTRMQNKRKVFLITNTLSPVVSYAISIPLLLKGLYIYALPLAAVTSSLAMSITFYFLNKEWFSMKDVSKEHLLSLVKIGVPLMPTFLMYWVCNSFDRVMIKSMLGLEDLGIYSVASRIAQISQFIYTAFAMGWQYFAFSTMNDEDQKKLTSNIANYLLIISIIATMGVTALSKVLFSILAKGTYSNGYIILPYLFIAPLLLMVFQIVGNQFIVIKKTYPIPLILLGAIAVNISCNYLLIPKIGIEGASIATMLGYIIAVIISYVITVKSKLLDKENRIITSIIIFLAYLLLWRVLAAQNIVKSIVITIPFLIIYLIIYKKELLMVIEKIKDK
ncbi:lipopolysaccharide biosynthesis protein [Clostridium tertium]|jgi:O-antigen/teichoic acid export membrane protein|uniref:lipopolysaccharide biosynthesis protein n=1 Tax=Clostridium tertium TaxID=1559 RepID=UPI0023B2E26C|nr:oligosaccharide flippase family protein [Clostridium tertium]